MDNCECDIPACFLLKASLQSRSTPVNFFLRGCCRFLIYNCERCLALTITSFEKFVVNYPLFSRMLHAYNRDTCNWGVLLSDAKYKSYSVLEASSDRKLLAVGSICGNLTVIDAGELPGFFLLFA